MIQFTLKCDQDHRFDSWFHSSDAFEKLQKAGHIACTICGSSNVEKAMMAPRVQDSRSRAPAPAPKTVPAPANKPEGPLSTPKNEAEQAMAELKKNIEKNSDYVGNNFVKEARNMHEGNTPERPIHGEAKIEEAKQLIEDGILVAPLPFVPRRKAN